MDFTLFRKPAFLRAVASHCLLFVTMGAVIFASLRLRPVEYADTADEGYYLAYASHVALEGIGKYASLFEFYWSDPNRWPYPNPLRIGFIIPAGIMVAVFGKSFATLTLLSALAALGLGQVNLLFARRYFGARAGLLIAALVGFSPLTLGLARRALADSYTTAWTCLTAWLFLEWIGRTPRSIGIGAAFAVAFLITVLTKETSVLLALPFLLFAAVRARAEHSPRPLLLTAAVIAGCVLATIGVYALFGLPLSGQIAAAKILLQTSSNLPYTQLYGSGPWYRFLVDLLVISPLPFLLATGWVAIRGAERRTIALDPPFLFFLLLTAALIFSHSFLSMNIRYVHVLVVPMAIFATLTLRRIARGFDGAPTRRRFLLLTAAGLLLLELLSFKTLFLDRNLYDTVSFHLLRARRMIPDNVPLAPREPKDR